MSKYQIQPLKASDLEPLKTFCDQQVGHGYYSQTDLEKILAQSNSHGQNVSFLLKGPNQEIVGVRLSLAPTTWSDFMKDNCCPEKWGLPSEEVGYFKSLFIDSRLQGQGWGPKLSNLSLEAMTKLGAKGVVCHSWKESPNNTSIRYLEKYGFQKVAEHPKFWASIPYDCTICKKPPCQCTGVEMIYKIEPTVALLKTNEASPNSD